MKTMNDEYRDGTDHEVCEDCGFCKTCGDCSCKSPNASKKAERRLR